LENFTLLSFASAVGMPALPIVCLGAAAYDWRLMRVKTAARTLFGGRNTTLDAAWDERAAKIHWLAAVSNVQAGPRRNCWLATPQARKA